MNFNQLFEPRLELIRSENRYRVFADLERCAGHFPQTFDHRLQDQVTVWCSNDYPRRSRRWLHAPSRPFPAPAHAQEDETEAVLLGLRYVDQRGDDVSPKLQQMPTPRSWQSYRGKGRLSRLCRWPFPAQRPKVFQKIRCRLARSGQRFERVGGLRSATSMPRGVRLGASFGLFNSASWTTRGS
jgi:hypothetical protein